MAIYHLSVKVLGRSGNHKVVAAAAYRAGERLYDERYAMSHDYSRKGGILFTEIITPVDAPTWVGDRESLWNAVEEKEKRLDAQLAREIVVALPRELSLEANIALLRHFVSEELVAKGMAVDLAIHDRHASDGQRNPHSHILVTMRPAFESGFGPKERSWNSTETVSAWREHWSVFCNEALTFAGYDSRIDHRTLEAQGILRDPTIHMGKEAFHAQQKGEEPERRQLSAVERSLGPFERQIEEDGTVDFGITPETGDGWWDRVANYTQRISDYAGEWYGWALDRLKGRSQRR